MGGLPSAPPALAAAILGALVALACFGASRRWAQGSLTVGVAAALVGSTVTTLLVTELALESVREWWQARPLTAGLVASILLLGATIFLVDEILSRRERRRWRSLSVHAVMQMQNAAVAARITVSNIWHEDPDTLAASEEAHRRAYLTGENRVDGNWTYESHLDELLLPPLTRAAEQASWRATVEQVLGNVERHAATTLAQWAVVTIGDEGVSPATDALASVVVRLEQVEWCLRNIRIAHQAGWADRGHSRYRIAADALPRLLLMLHREAKSAMKETELILASHGHLRLMDERIAQELGIPS